MMIKRFTLLVLTLLSVFNSFSQSIRKADSLFFAQDWAGAQKTYIAVLKDTSHSALAWNRLGFSNYHLHNYTDAMADYGRSLANKPSPPLRASVYSRMAKINSLQNKGEAALNNIDSAIANGYSGYLELDTLRDFNSIRASERFKKQRERVFISMNPCMGNAQARQCDFWVGEWNVCVTGTKTVVGHSIIQMVSGGCALLENWTSNASSGKSLNFVDPLTNKWRQTWVGSYAAGIQDFVNGEYTDGAMRFTFTSLNPQNQPVIGRFIFFNQGADKVRQFNETSADNGKIWVTGYDYTYLRVK